MSNSRHIDRRTTASKVYDLAEEIIVHFKEGQPIPAQEISLLILTRLYLSDGPTVNKIFNQLTEFHILKQAPGATFTVCRGTSYTRTSSNGTVTTYYLKGRPYAFSAYVLDSAALMMKYPKRLEQFSELREVSPFLPHQECHVDDMSGGSSETIAEKIHMQTDGRNAELSEREKAILGMVKRG